ncbi:MAG TPA: hypothetical protein VKZ49_18770 [Polyangiaceae bacterium]|nr:hypothetical protein [Polyangiaceae bacterium]
MRTLIALAVLGVCSVACQSTHDREPPPAEKAAPPAAEPATAAVTGPRQPPDHGLFKEDYEAQASTQITADNADRELDALEQEIARAEKALDTPAAQ